MNTATERDTLEMEGIVTRAERGDMYSIECELGALRRIVLARRAGRLVEAHIKIVPGDRVRVEVSPYDLSRGRITYRL